MKKKILRLSCLLLLTFATILPTVSVDMHANVIESEVKIDNQKLNNSEIQPLSQSITVSTETELKDAIANAPEGETTAITIINQIVITSVITYADKNIVLNSTLGDEVALIRGTNHKDHFFIVETGGSLTTSNIILDGNSETVTDSGGSFVYLKGKYYINEGTVLRNNSINSLNVKYPYGNTGSAAAVYATGEEALIEMTGGIITNNTTTCGYNGGSIHANKGAELNISGGEISYNSVLGSGGAIYSTGKVIISGDVKIHHNYAGQGGGAIFIGGEQEEEYVEFIMTGGDVYDNSCSGLSGGGAIYLYSKNTNRLTPVTITGGKVRNNISYTGSGGGVNASLTSLTVGGDVLFDGNRAGDEEWAAQGGAIGGTLNQVGDIKITGGTFVNNYAALNGGAVSLNIIDERYSTNGAIITGGTFKNNTAGDRGGAIYSNVACGEGTLIDGGINGIEISGNKAKKGGGVYAFTTTDKKIVLKNVTLEDNIAYFEENPRSPDDGGGYGGAIAVAQSAIVELHDVTITNNEAEVKGAAIAYCPELGGRNGKIIVFGNTQIGVDKNDNGAYLPTYETTLENYEMAIKIDGDLGEDAFINIENAERRYEDREASEVDDLVGRLVVHRDEKEFTKEELTQMYYQNDELRVEIDTQDPTQIVLVKKTVGELEIEGDDKVVIYRTGDTKETTGLFPNGYPFTHDFEMTIDGETITNEQLEDITWTVEVADGFSESNTYVTIENGTNTVVAKKSGVVKLTATYGESTASVYVIIPGDVNRDGYLNGQDSSRIQFYNSSKDVSQLGPVDEFTLLLADLNGDGYINGQDSSIVQFMNSRTISPSN